MKKRLLKIASILYLVSFSFLSFAPHVQAGALDEDPAGLKYLQESGETLPGGITNPILDPSAGNNPGEAQSGSLFFKMINGTIQFMMILATIIVLINLLQAGIEWISSGGDSTKLENARKRITNAVIGIIVLSASVAIWMMLKQFLGFEISFGPLLPQQPGLTP